MCIRVCRIAVQIGLSPIYSNTRTEIDFLDNGNLVFQVLLMFAVLNLISKKVEDRTLILFGYVCEVVTLAYLMWYLPSAPRRKYNTELQRGQGVNRASISW